MTEQTKAEAFDFSALDLAEATDKPFEFELKHPVTEEGLGVFVSVVGSDSETFQRYLRTEGNKARRRNFEAQRKGKSDVVSVEEEEDTVLKALAACMTGWRTVIAGKSEPVVIWDKRKLEFSEANALAWLRRFRWVRGQINAATADLGNFITA